MSPTILVCSESSSGAYELLTKGRDLAKTLGFEISALAIGKKTEKDVESFFEYGAQKVLSIPAVDPAELDASTYAYVLSEVAKDDGPDILLINSSRLGKETAGRAAARLGAGCITDATGLNATDQKLVVNRYALGGNTVSSEIIKTRKKVISILPRTFEPSPAPAYGTVETIDLKIRPSRLQILDRKKKVGEATSIESAETLICVGKGISKQEDLAMISDLCKSLKAELGCTRALSADYHWISEDRMVGISGKKCKPKLHISIGISGQIQHTVGILNSKLIVAINKDKEAPIFKIADYGIVGDLYQVVPKLAERTKTP